MLHPRVYLNRRKLLEDVSFSWAIRAKKHVPGASPAGFTSGTEAGVGLGAVVVEEGPASVPVAAEELRVGSGFDLSFREKMPLKRAFSLSVVFDDPVF